MKLSKFLVLVKRLGIIGVDTKKVTIKELLSLDSYLAERQEKIKTIEDAQAAVEQFFDSKF